ncbi:hypothetical protein LguiA_035977 [Lonicera macranthoides]
MLSTKSRSCASISKAEKEVRKEAAVWITKILPLPSKSMPFQASQCQEVSQSVLKKGKPVRYARRFRFNNASSAQRIKRSLHSNLPIVDRDFLSKAVTIELLRASNAGFLQVKVKKAATETPTAETASDVYIRCALILGREISIQEREPPEFRYSAQVPLQPIQSLNIFCINRPLSYFRLVY